MTKNLESSATTEGIPLTEGMGPVLESASLRRHSSLVDSRVLLISALAVGVGLVAGLVARALTALIGLITNLCFYGRVSADFSSPAEHHLGAWVIVVPMLGGIVVGLMARFGSKAIRGHGIPEAMEQILINESRVPARITFLKPLSAAISIGTGGPFGAEGPIIATGGALGSLVGQLLRTTASERKVLLAAGAAAGMTATFGSPVSAVLLAVELLLFEFKPRSLIPVALSSAAAAAVRLTLVGSAPAFAMPDILQVRGSSIAFYILLGALVGVISVYVTKAVYWIEDAFEEIPIHWMWWPALGGVVVGVVGYLSPHTLGVGYDNIEHILSGSFTGQAMLFFCLMKFISWSISLGSGTSGGTLAPLFTIGGGVGAGFGLLGSTLLPGQGIDPRVAALVGMAAIFTGASRALLTSVVFAFEATRQPLGLLPLLGGCTASFLVSCLLMKNTIMTEKIVRRGVRVPAEYAADDLEQALVENHYSKNPVVLERTMTIALLRDLVRTQAERYSHQGFPVVDEHKRVVGVITRRDFTGDRLRVDSAILAVLKRDPVVIFTDNTLREAADLMAQEGIGRLPVLESGMRGVRGTLVGMLTRSDILGGHQRRLRETRYVERSIRLGGDRPA